MHKFTYFHIYTINSYLVQIYDGLLHSSERDIQNSKSNDNQSSHNVLGNGNTNLDILGNQVEGKLQYTYEHLKDTNNIELIRYLQTKLLHDNAFDQLISYLNSNKLIVSSDYGIT